MLSVGKVLGPGAKLNIGLKEEGLRLLLLRIFLFLLGLLGGLNSLVLLPRFGGGVGVEGIVGLGGLERLGTDGNLDPDFLALDFGADGPVSIAKLDCSHLGEDGLETIGDSGAGDGLHFGAVHVSHSVCLSGVRDFPFPLMNIL